MPSKIQLDENLWFLYVCLQKSDFKAIDFNAVGEATGLKPPAARMRYTRLRRHIVNGTLIGTHGTPFQGGPFQGGLERTAQAQGKRKKSSSMIPKEGSEDPGYTRACSESRIEKRLKSEVERSDGYEVDSGDEQDEMPLAKICTVSDGRGQLKGVGKPATNVGKAVVEEQTGPKRGLSQHNAAEPTTPIDLASASPRQNAEERPEALSNAPISNVRIKSQSRTSINAHHQTQPPAALEPSAVEGSLQTRASPSTLGGPRAESLIQTPSTLHANQQSGSATPPPNSKAPIIKIEDGHVPLEPLVREEESEDQKYPFTS